MTELLAFTKSFYDGNQIHQQGVSHTKSSESNAFNLSLWHSDFVKNTFEKETHERDLCSTLLKRGNREGRNEHGEHWTETWTVASDGSEEAWTRETKRDS